MWVYHVFTNVETFVHSRFSTEDRRKHTKIWYSRDWIKPRIVNQHSVVYCFKCDLCDSNYVGYTTRHLCQRIADHRYSAIGRHLRDAHGNIDLLNESQFRMLKKCSTKWDCLVYEMLYIRTIRPNLNTQSDSIRAKLFVWLSMPFNLFISSLYILDFIIYFHLIMTFWKRRNVVLCFIIFYRRFLLSNVLPNLYLFEYYW